MRLRLTWLALVLAVAASALLAAEAVGGKSAGITYREWLETVGPNSMGYTIENLGTTPIRLVALRGKTFDVGALGQASATSGPAPTCAVSGQPATIRCAQFELAKGGSLSIRFTATGAGRTAERAITDGAEPTVTSFFATDAQQPQVRGTYGRKRVGKRVSISGRNTGFVRWTRVTFVYRAGRHARIVSFRVVGGRLLASEARRSGACTTQETGGTTTLPKHEEIACHASVDAGFAFFAILLGGDEGYLVVKGANGQLTTLDKIDYGR